MATTLYDDDAPVGRVLTRREVLTLFGDGYAATFPIGVQIG